MKRYKTVYFRADGNAHIGLGHIIRSLALADMLAEHFSCVFLVQNPAPELTAQIQERHSLIKLPQTVDYLSEARKLVDRHLFQNSTVVLDGYEFSTEYQQIIKSSGITLVCIDDLHAWHFFADAVINHGGGITPSQYSCEKFTQLFLGLDYALLRMPFLKLAQAIKPKSVLEPNKVMIAMGGADTENYTLKILKRIAEVERNERFCVVLGSAYTHQVKLDEFIRTTSLGIQLFKNLSATDMAELMLVCSCAITPPSGLSYEYLCTGGTLYLKTTADNQKNIYEFLIQNNFALDFENDFSISKSISQNPFRPIDGQSPNRILAIFKTISGISEVDIRKATNTDIDQYYNWVNEMAVRKNAIDTNPIAYQDHIKWFSKKLKSNDALLYFFEKGGKAIGQVRFELCGGEIMIDYSLDRSARGRGLGKIILIKAMEKLYQESESWQKSKLVAVVKVGNHQSSKIFNNLNFILEENFELNSEFFQKFTK